MNESGLKQEFQALSTIHNVCSHSFKKLVPRPIALLELSDDLVSLETVLPGRSMQACNSFSGEQATIDAHFEIAYRWLMQFHQETTTKFLLFDRRTINEEIVNPVLNRCDALNITKKGKLYVKAVLKNVNALLGKSLPVVFLHGDLEPSNILLSKNEVVGVVDWEYSSFSSLPFVDWFNFAHLYYWNGLVTRLAHSSFADSRVNAIRNAILLPGVFSTAVAQWTNRLFSQYGIETELAPLFFLHFLVTMYPDDNMLSKLINDVASIQRMTNSIFLPPAIN